MCDHNHGGECCHSLDITDPTSSFSLYQHIDIQNVQCFNEHIAESGKKVFKPYEDRKDNSVYVESDDDAELLFSIPFNGNIKLKALIISGFELDQHPKEIHLFKNKPFMTLSDTDVEADQSITLIQDPFGDVIYPLKVARFANTHHLSIHIETNYGADLTRLHYIGFRGDHTPTARQTVVITNYELTPNLADHKADMMKHNSYLIE